MTLRTGITLIGYATFAAAILTVAAFVSYFMGWKNPIYLAAYGALIAGVAIIALGKKYWVRYMLRKVSYPGILYSVCEELGYLRNLSIAPSQDVLNDLYKPAYTTEAFLKDNNLTAAIYPAKPGYKQFSAVFLFSLLALFANSSKIPHPYREFFPVLAFTWLGAGAILGNTLKQRKDLSAMPVYVFEKDGLHIGNDVLEWSNVYLWEFVPSKTRGELAYIQIRLNQPVHEQQIFLIQPGDIAVSYTEILILLNHYKYKYGYTANEE